MAFFKRKSRTDAPEIIKLPKAYIEQLRRRFGKDLSKLEWEIEVIQANKLIITPVMKK